MLIEYIKFSTHIYLISLSVLIEYFKFSTICTANSKKVVLRKSKIQITKYKIQEKVCHMSGLLTSSP